ncbi:MAG: ABC transporter permease [Lachnospira sp.]|nr:ABC transporter permease [Lachnospira sp.]
MKHMKHLIKPYLIWSLIIVVIPMVLVMLYSVTTAGNSLVNIQFTLDNFKKLGNSIYVKVFTRSLSIGGITTGICLLIGYPIAYIISRKKETVQGILILLVTIPMWINMLLRTYALMNIISETGFINTLLISLGFDKIEIMYTDVAVVLGLVIDLLPFMILPIHTILNKMDKSYVEAAYDLGANKFTTFKKIIFKMSLPGVVNGVIMVFILSISSFVIPKMLGGGQYVLIGNIIEEQFITQGNWNLGSAISMILIVLMLIVIRVMNKLDKDE